MRSSFSVSRQAKVADGIRAACDALDEDIVVFGELDVGSVQDASSPLPLSASVSTT